MASFAQVQVRTSGQRLPDFFRWPFYLIAAHSRKCCNGNVFQLGGSQRCNQYMAHQCTARRVMTEWPSGGGRWKKDGINMHARGLGSLSIAPCCKQKEKCLPRKELQAAPSLRPSLRWWLARACMHARPGPYPGHSHTGCEQQASPSI